MLQILELHMLLTGVGNKSLKGGKMGSFNGFILTNNGKKLLEEALTGKRLVFTKFQFGDGETTEDPKEVTELVNMSKETAINQIENNGNGQVMLRVIIDNKDIDTGYYIKEIGVFAKCDDGEEVLYAYNKAMKPDYLPVYNGINLVELEYQNYITIAQIEDVTAIIDENFTYLTKEEANEKFVRQTQIANESERGIISGLDIRRTEILNVLGIDYGGEFGENLTSIKADKVYFYKDPKSGRTTPYVALVSKTGIFKTPEIGLFTSLTNRDNLLYKKLTLAHSTLNNINIVNAFLFGNLLFVNGFVTNATWFNSLPVGSAIANIGTMIPEIMNHGVENTTVTGTNLDLRTDFSLTKALANLTVKEAEHFTIIAGLTKGTIR